MSQFSSFFFFCHINMPIRVPTHRKSTQRPTLNKSKFYPDGAKWDSWMPPCWLPPMVFPPHWANLTLEMNETETLKKYKYCVPKCHTNQFAGGGLMPDGVWIKWELVTLQFWREERDCPMGGSSLYGPALSRIVATSHI